MADSTLVLPKALSQAIAAFQAGNLGAAARICKQILGDAPDYAAAMHLLGVIESERGHPDRGLRLLTKALKLDPKSASIHLDLGNMLLALGKPGDALAHYGQALALRPDYTEALSNRGSALFALGRPEEALASFDSAIALRPEYAKALNNRGGALYALQRYEDALASFDAALAAAPNYADALSNRGNALLELGRTRDALASFERALAVQPDFAGALNNRGNALMTLGRPEEAAGDFERVLHLAPDYDYTRGKLFRARMQCCDWTNHDKELSRIVSGVRAGKRVDQPFSFLAVSDSAADQLLCARIFAKDKCPLSPEPLWRGERYNHARIRVAYLSADFRDHPVAQLTAGLFELHDRSRFETVAISFGAGDERPMRARLQNAFERFLDVRGKSDRDIAALLRDMEIDIAVDLMGFTTDCRPRILAFRPCPVQISYLGFPGTMGASHVDYIVADRAVIPEDRTRHYAEKIVYLPDAYQANDSKRPFPELAQDRAAARAKAGLPAAAFVFCSFCNSYKITPRMFDVWMRLLKQAEGSVLWLLGNGAVGGNLRREAQKRGVDPARLVFAPRAGFEDYLARYRLADLFLDTLPFNGGTTASDALWMGLPLVTCLGDAFAARMAGSLLQAVGLPELATRSLQDYEQVALSLARDRAALEAIKSKLAAARSTAPLFDTARFTRNLEVAYETMMEKT